MLVFLKKYKWLNFFVAVIGSAGVVFLSDAAHWKFFVDNPSMLVALGTIVGLFTRFYKAHQTEIDGEILSTGSSIVVVKTDPMPKTSDKPLVVGDSVTVSKTEDTPEIKPE